MPPFNNAPVWQYGMVILPSYGRGGDVCSASRQFPTPQRKKTVHRFALYLTLTSALLTVTASAWAVPEQTTAGEKSKLLILDGQNNHDWKATTPVMKKALVDAGLFQVDVSTSPPRGQDLSGWKPDFAAYDVVLSNYNGAAWPAAVRKAFVDYVRNGGGFVCVHAADNAFGNWGEYNEIIGVGGWGGRNENSGPYVYFTKDGKEVRDTSEGRAGSHGPQHEFQIVIRDGNHPITRGMPKAWLHAKDELYDYLRGPAAKMQVLATAYAAKQQRGSDNHVPMMIVIEYGQGRIFHTPMGHADYSMRCVGFETTLIRGAEWAATGNVTFPVPDDFPTADAVSNR